jgi:hypothetical protein
LRWGAAIIRSLEAGTPVTWDLVELPLMLGEDTTDCMSSVRIVLVDEELFSPDEAVT